VQLMHIHLHLKCLRARLVVYSGHRCAHSSTFSLSFQWLRSLDHVEYLLDLEQQFDTTQSSLNSSNPLRTQERVLR
jgi:hypothetical protein